MPRLGISLFTISAIFFNSVFAKQNDRIPQFVEKPVSYPTISAGSFSQGKRLSTDSSQLYKMPNGTIYEYQRPRPFEFVGNIFRNLYQLPQVAVHRNTLPVWGGIVGTTGLAYYFDDELITISQRFGHWAGIPGDNSRGLNTNNQRVNLINNSTLGVYVPGDIGYALYYIGDGLTDIAIMGGFWGYGLVKKDYRALRVASELMEGLASVGFTIQVLKRSFGRQSPWVADMEGVKRGEWNPFSPNYNKSVPAHDAMPSGHLATATMVLIVIGDNYSEYKWIYPTGIGLMSLLGFQMMNNGVHWMSDYPLGIAVGYAMGKMIVARGRRVVQQTEQKTTKPKLDYQINPFYTGNYGGLSFSLRF